MVLMTVSLLGSCSLQRKVYKQDGDLIIGGLIPLHYFNESSGNCNAKRDIGSLRLVEAIAFAISKVNEGNRLRGLRLGYEIYDTCSSMSGTLKSALAFIPPLREEDNILSVVGPQRSDSSLIGTRLLGLYNISIVSYLSTSDELSNDKMYPYFFRTVPPDKFQVNVIIDIVTKFGWEYVVFIYSDDTYGNNAKAEFVDQALDNDVCIAFSRGISLSATDDDYNQTIGELLRVKKDSLVSVVILFIQREMAKQFFTHAHNRGIERDFIWIGSDGWGNYALDPVEGVEESALGAFTIVPKSGNLEGFDDFFYTNRMTPPNPWTIEFQHELDACRKNRGSCNGDNGRPQYESTVADAVEVIVLALEKMMKNFCRNMRTCKEAIINNRPRLRDCLLKVSFLSPSNGQINFTSNGDATGRYDIKNLQPKKGGGYTFTNVGSWTQTFDSHVLNIDEIEWFLKSNGTLNRYTNQNIPKSVCSDPCEMWEIRVDKDECCWTCDKECKRDDEIIRDNHCISCYRPENNSYEWPSLNGTHCEPLAPLKIFDEEENIGIIICASVGILTEIAVIVFFIIKFNEKLIRASSRELGLLVLVGILICYISAILYSVPASDISCTLVRVVPNVGLSLIYVSIATMTIRLHRIFQAGKKSVKRPSFISPRSQIMVTLVLSVMPLLWSIIWILIEPVKVHTVRPNSDQRFLERNCVDSTIHMIGQLGWHFAVVLVCCFFAVRTRHLPDNYNQSRFIAFAAFCSIIVFIAFTPAYFTSDSSRTKDLYSSLGAIVQATVILILLFIVRLYAVYFVAEERQQVISTSAISVPTTSDDTPRITMLKRPIKNHYEDNQTKIGYTT